MSDPTNDHSATWNRTPVCFIVNAINLKCVEAAKSGDDAEARRFARLSFTVEEAIRESGWWDLGNDFEAVGK